MKQLDQTECETAAAALNLSDKTVTTRNINCTKRIFAPNYPTYFNTNGTDTKIVTILVNLTLCKKIPIYMQFHLMENVNPGNDYEHMGSIVTAEGMMCRDAKEYLTGSGSGVMSANSVNEKRPYGCYRIQNNYYNGNSLLKIKTWSDSYTIDIICKLKDSARATPTTTAAPATTAASNGASLTSLQ